MTATTTATVAARGVEFTLDPPVRVDLAAHPIMVDFLEVWDRRVGSTGQIRRRVTVRGKRGPLGPPCSLDCVLDGDGTVPAWSEPLPPELAEIVKRVAGPRVGAL